MTLRRKRAWPIAVALALGLLTAGDLSAQDGDPPVSPEAELDGLMEELGTPDLRNWQSVEDKIYRIWSKSGSPSADLLLERGRKAIEAQDYLSAIEHLTALTDHAPDFAEGWNSRATAFYLIGEYGLSIQDIQRAVALNPRHFGALSGLGLILEELGDLENALKAYKLVAEMHPNREDIGQAVERLQREAGEISL